MEEIVAWVSVMVENSHITTLRPLFARQARGKRKLVLKRCFVNYRFRVSIERLRKKKADLAASLWVVALAAIGPLPGSSGSKRFSMCRNH
jgi:hypothetical protein